MTTVDIGELVTHIGITPLAVATTACQLKNCTCTIHDTSGPHPTTAHAVEPPTMSANDTCNTGQHAAVPTHQQHTHYEIQHEHARLPLEPQHTGWQ